MLHRNVIGRLPLRPLAVALAVFLACGHQAAFARDNVTIKIATVIPDRTSWVLKLQDIFRDVHKQTDGRLRFIVYAGGIAGDELDIIRKMRSRQLHAGFLTGVGLGSIVSAVRIFETPGLFQNYDEVDYLKEDMFPSFQEDFRKAGYELLAFIDGGPIYLFSMHDLTRTDSLGRIRMWAYQGDRAQMNFIRDLGMSPVPLHIGDVNVGLEMGMVDSFYGPAPVVNAFQWCKRAHYMLDFPVSNAITAVIISRRFFDGLAPDMRQQIANAFQNGASDMIQQIRRDNAASIDIIRDQGVEVLAPGEDAKRFYRERFAINIEQIIASGVFTRKQYQDVLRNLETFRNRKNGKTP